jgi:hypothetical protein
MKQATARMPRRTGPRHHQRVEASTQEPVLTQSVAVVAGSGGGATRGVTLGVTLGVRGHTAHWPFAHGGDASAWSSGSTSLTAGDVASTGNALTAAEYNTNQSNFFAKIARMESVLLME